MAIGTVLVATGLYLSWRGYSFLGDSVTRNVAYVTGSVSPVTVTARGWTYYYIAIGPLMTRISRRTYRRVPDGLRCHAYYGSGSRHLLSLEPATAAEPYPSLRFGRDAAHAWDRLRWRPILAAVAAFGVAAGLHSIAIAYPAQAFLVSGQISSYEETTGRGAYRHLYLEGNSRLFYVNNRSSYSPPIPDLGSYVGSRVDLYLNGGSADVLAVRLNDTLYAADYYFHPLHQKENMTWSGVAIGLLSGIGLGATLWWRLPGRTISRLNRGRWFRG